MVTMYPNQIGYALAQRRCDPKWLGGLWAGRDFVVARAWSAAEAAEITETDEDRITVSEPSTSLQKRYLFHFSRGHCRPLSSNQKSSFADGAYRRVLDRAAPSDISAPA